MSHYKSNVRDQVFNLFEVFGIDKAFGEGAYTDLDADTAREMLAEMSRLAEGPVAESFVDARPQPAGVRPRDPLGDAARVVQEVGARGASRAVGTRSASTRNSAACRCPRRWCGRCTSTCWAPTRRSGCTAAAPASPASSTTSATEEQKKWAVHRRRARLGRHDGAHRAGRGLGRRRRPHQGRPAGRRLLAHRRREAVHHLRRLRRPVREHRPPGAGAPRGRRPGHQGPVAVLRAEVPVRLRDRRARRAQRRLRHQRRAQDGPEGLRDLRADLRPARRAGQGLAGRRGARRHRADVRGHRARPDDGRHQGHRDAVDRLPERARLRQGAACRAPT